MAADEVTVDMFMGSVVSGGAFSVGFMVVGSAPPESEVVAEMFVVVLTVV